MLEVLKWTFVDFGERKRTTSKITHMIIRENFPNIFVNKGKIVGFLYWLESVNLKFLGNLIKLNFWKLHVAQNLKEVRMPILGALFMKDKDTE